MMRYSHPSLSHLEHECRYEMTVIPLDPSTNPLFIRLALFRVRFILWFPLFIYHSSIFPMVHDVGVRLENDLISCLRYKRACRYT